jgi:hypothetical protein
MRVLSALVVVLSLGGSTPAADTPAEPITKPVEQTLFDGKVKVRVADDDTTIRIEVTFAGSANLTTETMKAKSATAKGWFVVAASAGRVWVYRGGDALFLLEHTENPLGGPAGGTSSTLGLAPSSEKTAAALAKAPKAVLERLPASFKTPTKDK